MILFLLFFILYNQILQKAPLFNGLAALGSVVVYHFILGADSGIAKLFARLVHG